MRRLLIPASIAAALLSASPLAAVDRSQGRSMVISQYGIVAAEQPLAARAGTAILEAGGNAIDAAVAANAVMGLVAPMMDGIGGDLFAIVYDAKTDKVYGLNASGWAPEGSRPTSSGARASASMPSSGIHSVTVPGAVAGWDALLTRFGKKTFADVLAPAIAYAQRRLSRHRDFRRRLGRDRRLCRPQCRGRPPLSAQSPLPRGRRHFPQSGPRTLARRDRRRRPRRLLQGIDREAHSRHLGEIWRHHGGRRPCRFRRRMGRPGFDHLSRLDRLRDAAQRAGHRGADDAQHHGAAFRSANGATIRSSRCMR